MESSKDIIARDAAKICNLVADETLLQNIGIREKERRIMRMLWCDNMNFEEIAAELHLSPIYVKKTYNWALLKLCNRFIIVLRLINDNKELSTENAKLRESLRYVEKRLRELDSAKKEIKSPFEEKLSNPVYRTKIIDLKLSTRAYYALRFGSAIETVADLVNYSRKDLLKISHLGKKTLNEIESVLENQFGLKLKEK